MVRRRRWVMNRVLFMRLYAETVESYIYHSLAFSLSQRTDIVSIILVILALFRI